MRNFDNKHRPEIINYSVMRAEPGVQLAQGGSGKGRPLPSINNVFYALSAVHLLLPLTGYKIIPEHILRDFKTDRMLQTDANAVRVSIYIYHFESKSAYAVFVMNMNESVVLPESHYMPFETLKKNAAIKDYLLIKNLSYTNLERLFSFIESFEPNTQKDALDIFNAKFLPRLNNMS